MLTNGFKILSWFRNLKLTSSYETSRPHRSLNLKLANHEWMCVNPTKKYYHSALDYW